MSVRPVILGTFLSLFVSVASGMAARTGNPEAVKRLLDRGAQINTRESWGNTTALMWAASEKHPQVVKLLIDRGADVRVRSKIVPAAKGRGDGSDLGFSPRDPEA